MAEELGYEQITGVVYVKPRDGWYETFNLQNSSYGNPFFYFNYGVILPNEFPASREELRDSGWYLGRRLSYNGEGAFPSQTKKEIEESAEHLLRLYKEEVVPLFEKMTITDVNDQIKKRMA